MHKILQYSKEKLNFEYVSKKDNIVTYKASFWDGEKQRYEYTLVEDSITEIYKQDGSKYKKLRNTAENCSFYSELKKRAKF